MALLSGSAFLLFAGGVNALILPVRGEIEGFTAASLGLLGTGWAIGYVAGCLRTPALVAKVGHIRAFGVMCALAAITVLLSLLVMTPWVWVPLRGISGFCFAGAAMIVESWLNERVDAGSRGRVFGVYTMVNLAATTAGQMVVDMRTLESVLFFDGANTVRPSDGGTGINTSQFLLPLGNLLVTGGIGPHQGMAIWAHQAEPDTRGPSVGYHVPQAGRTGYPTGAPISLLIHETLETPTIVNGVSFIVRPLGGAAISGRLIFAFDDVLTFTPDEPLEPDTTYEVVLPADGIRDAAGNGMVGYSFAFSTGRASPAIYRRS